MKRTKREQKLLNVIRQIVLLAQGIRVSQVIACCETPYPMKKTEKSCTKNWRKIKALQRKVWEDAPEEN